MDIFKKIAGSGNVGMIYFYVAVAVVILTEVSLGIFAIPGYYARLREKMTSVSVKSEEVSSYGESLQMLATLDGSQIDGYLTKVTMALPDEKKTSGIVSGMSALASSSGVVVTGLEFSPGVVAASSSGMENKELGQDIVVDPGLNIRVVPASLTIMATPDSLITFLERLSLVSQLIGVKAVSFVADQKEQIKVTILIAIYYQPRDISKFSFKGLKPVSDEEANLIQNLPDEDLFVLPDQNSSGKFRR